MCWRSSSPRVESCSATSFPVVKRLTMQVCALSLQLLLLEVEETEEEKAEEGGWKIQDVVRRWRNVVRMWREGRRTVYKVRKEPDNDQG